MAAIDQRYPYNRGRIVSGDFYTALQPGRPVVLPVTPNVREAGRRGVRGVTGVFQNRPTCSSTTSDDCGDGEMCTSDAGRSCVPMTVEVWMMQTDDSDTH